jgi:hypothetical protein
MMNVVNKIVPFLIVVAISARHSVCAGVTDVHNLSDDLIDVNPVMLPANVPTLLISVAATVRRAIATAS